MLETKMSKRAYGRAHADGLSLSAIMRRFVVDYCGERALREPLKPRPSSLNRSG